MYDVAIIGGGPGGVAAGIYAARKKLKGILITDSFGGQSLVSDDIQNWIGAPSVSGLDLSQMLENHLRSHEGLEILDGEWVKGVKNVPGGIALELDGKNIEARYLLLATGSRRKKLDVPGEKEFEGKGVVYCSICDAPLFKDKDVAVVGGGNAGIEAVIDLLPYASKIYLLDRREDLHGDAVTVEKIKSSPKVTIINNAEAREIVGDKFVSKIVYFDKKSGSTPSLDVQGVFVEIGAIPNSDIVKDLVKLNERGEVVVDHKTQRSSHERIWAVGDVSDVLYKQNNVSAGDGIKALLNIYERITKEN